MCGIAGLVHLDGEKAELSVIEKMTDAIAHRGPDGEGQWCEGYVGIGHRRLSVLDLSVAAKQPMIDPDGRYVLTYNGEVFNFRELRKELERRGYAFRSTGDTEVVLNSLIEWGPEAIGRFNGMFALGLWDRHERKLLLARDRYGIKPLYFAETKDTFLFGSEQKALLASGRIDRQLDYGALVEYLTFQNILTDRTLFNQVRLLPAGNIALLDMKQSVPSLKCTQYWEFSFVEPSNRLPDIEYVEELTRLFSAAVERQLVADVELGSYLSGGLDSGYIAAVASRKIEDLKTFTCGFDLSSASRYEHWVDERSQAKALSDQLGTRHKEMVLKAGDLEGVMPILASHIEEPRVGHSCANYLVAGLASESVKVVLSGAGGDELFGGYPWRYSSAKSSSQPGEFLDQYYGSWHRLMKEGELQRLLLPMASGESVVHGRDIFQEYFHGKEDQLTSPEGRMNACFYFEAKTFLHGILVVEDKLSMAHGLECRVPFLDNDLVDFAMSCPAALKVNGNVGEETGSEEDPGSRLARDHGRTSQGKQILRKAISKEITVDFTSATKQGFVPPTASWFRGDESGYVRRVLFDQNSLLGGYLDQEVVESLVTEHLEGLQDRQSLIWSLISVEQWLQNEIGGNHPG